MAATAFREQSKAGSCIKTLVTSPAHEVNKLKQCLAIKKASLHLYGFFHPRILAHWAPRGRLWAHAQAEWGFALLTPPPNPTGLSAETQAPPVQAQELRSALHQSQPEPFLLARIRSAQWHDQVISVKPVINNMEPARLLRPKGCLALHPIPAKVQHQLLPKRAQETCT